MRSILLLWLLLPLSVFAQSKTMSRTGLYKKAKEHYDKNEYREALLYLRKYTKLDSSKALIYKWRGNCYTTLNYLDSAERDYIKALSLSPSMTEVYYHLSNVYNENGVPEKALTALRKYVKKRSVDAQGLYRMGLLMQEIHPDSALYYLQRAHRADSINGQIIMALASEYYLQNDFASAIAMSQKAAHTKSSSAELFRLLTNCNLARGNYPQAVRWADSLIKLEPTLLPHHALRARSEILAQTDTMYVSMKGYTARLKHTDLFQIDSLDKRSAITTHRYHYPTLQQTFNHQGRLSLDEYFAVYEGYVTDQRYSPDRTLHDSTLLHYLNDQQYDTLFAEAHEMLAQNEFDPIVYESLVLAHFRLQQETEFRQALLTFIGLMEGILASGTGSSADDAYVIVAPADALVVLRYLGLSFVDRSTVTVDGHAYDVVRAKPDNETTLSLYFNVDWSRRSFVKTSKKVRGKKKKRKKQ